MPHPPRARSQHLEAYRAKRDAGRTPEPFGRDGIERPGLFVVQQHAARNLHYDLRIEVDGVEVGVTPLAQVPLAAGPRQIRARMPDGRVVERVVEVDAETRFVAFE